MNAVIVSLDDYRSPREVRAITGRVAGILMRRLEETHPHLKRRHDERLSGRGGEETFGGDAA